MVLRRGKYGQFYGCQNFPDCNGTMKADPAGNPIGIPADSRMKAWRKRAHEHIEEVVGKVWHAIFWGTYTDPDAVEKTMAERTRAAEEHKKLQRRNVYNWLAEQLQIDPNHCRLDMMTEDILREAIEACRRARTDDVISWIAERTPNADQPQIRR